MQFSDIFFSDGSLQLVQKDKILAIGLTLETVLLPLMSEKWRSRILQFNLKWYSLHNLWKAFIFPETEITTNGVLLHCQKFKAVFLSFVVLAAHRTNATVAEYPVENAPIGHNLDFNMVPFFPPVRNREMFVPSEQLGYSYAVEFPGELNSNAWKVDTLKLSVLPSFFQCI